MRVLACVLLVSAGVVIVPGVLAGQQAAAPAVRGRAPTGKVRAAINFGNPVLATRDATTGEARGVSVDLARELARRLGVPAELVLFNAAGKVVEAIKAKETDVGFVAIDPARAVDMDY